MKIMGYCYWLYSSISALPGLDADLVLHGLVPDWQKRNVTLSVTGALIFTGSRFAQYIEGPSAGLSDLRKRIAEDDRHADVRTSGEGMLTRRRFDRWSLAYSGRAVPFDRLVAQAHASEPISASILLLEMIRRFTHVAD